MKLLSFLIYPILTLSSSCFAMDTLHTGQSELPKNKLKRSSSLDLGDTERNSKKIGFKMIETYLHLKLKLISGYFIKQKF